MGVPDLLRYAIPVFFVVIVLDYYQAMNSDPGQYSKRDSLNNFGLGVLSYVTATLLSGMVLGVYYWSYTGLASWRLNTLGYEYIGWTWWAWLFGLIADDFTFYWFHRSSHTVRVMWASHVIHHSSEHYNFSTSLRNASIGALYKPFLWVWMTVLGFHPLMVLSCMAIETVYQFFLHTKSLPAWDRFSAVLNTPGLHEVHHGKDPFCIDKNYGGMTIIFDRLFGTYQPIQFNQQIQFGVTHPPRVQSILEITLHEFRSLFNDIVRCKSVWIAIQYAANKPGWKPSTKHNRATSIRSRSWLKRELYFLWSCFRDASQPDNKIDI